MTTSSVSATMFGYSPSPAHSRELSKLLGSLSASLVCSFFRSCWINFLDFCRNSSGTGSPLALSLRRIFFSSALKGVPAFSASFESSATMCSTGSSWLANGLLRIQDMGIVGDRGTWYLCGVSLSTHLDHYRAMPHLTPYPSLSSH